MTLVERFIEFDRWPVSRKTALLSGIALLFQLGMTSLVTQLNTRVAWIDSAVLNAVAWTFTVVLGVSLVLSLIAVWRGWEGRWTAAFLIIGYGFVTAVFLWGLGTTTTSMTMTFPLLILLMTLWYGPIYGFWSLIYGVCLTTVVVFLPAFGLAPFAPFIRDRTLDAQNSPLVVSIVLGTGLAIFLLIFALIVLLILARRAQQARLDDAYRQLDRSAKLIRRYVPSQLADKIIKGEHSEDSRPERAKLTIFFSDLVGFSEIAEEMEPEDLSRVLNEYFSEMTAIAQKHGGTVDELSGDAILIFFGAPVATNDKDHALRAVRMATDMQQAMGALNARWRAAGITEVLQVRMGINTGVVTIGNFGSPDRMKYAALGKHVNLAARIQAECEPGRVLISQSTWLLVSDQVQCTPKGETQFKGIAKPVMTYELASA
ncbi:MAG: adenylate/guanylate cyclase domain-containing protein [Nevskiales bacterium]